MHREERHDAGRGPGRPHRHFGVGSLVVAAMGLRHQALAPFLAFGIGCAQMIWIVVQLAIIRDLSFLHPLMFATGLVIAVAAVPWGLPAWRAWRAGAA
jgi:hypothetical protein